MRAQWLASIIALRNVGSRNRHPARHGTRGATIVGFYAPASERETFSGKRIWRQVREVETHDARLLSGIVAPANRYKELKAMADGIPLLVPAVLRLGPYRD